ncbi:hypothetical protein [uncultured Enterovirga sp.]|uniref:hypothetical protein n=1 Tax=uncultured Enterovirga sp. TaxID=2026352 RepID=UPI0035C9A79E
MRDARHNQLTATWLNTVAAGIVSGGFVSQLTMLMDGATLAGRTAVVVLSISVGLALHVAAIRWMSREPGSP